MPLCVNEDVDFLRKTVWRRPWHAFFPIPLDIHLVLERGNPEAKTLACDVDAAAGCLARVIFCWVVYQPVPSCFYHSVASKK